MADRLDFKIGCFFLTLSILVIVFMIPTISDDWREASFTSAEMFTIGPRFFPYLAAAIISLLSTALILTGARSRKAIKETNKTYFTLEQIKNVTVFIVFGVIYIVLFQVLGVLIATPLCLLCYFIYFEVQGWPWRIGLSLGTTIIIYFCFAKMMMVPLPMGLLE